MKRVLEKEKMSSSFAHGLTTIEPGTGQVKAMAVNRIYSVDQSANGPTRLYRARRGPGSYPNTVAPLLGGGDIPGYQAGSTFKFFTMLAALEAGMPLTTAFHSPQQLVSQYPGRAGAGRLRRRDGARRTPAAAMTGVQTCGPVSASRSTPTSCSWNRRSGPTRWSRWPSGSGLRWRTEVDQMMPTRRGPRLGPVHARRRRHHAAGDGQRLRHRRRADGVYCEPMPGQPDPHPDGKDLAASPSATRRSRPTSPTPPPTRPAA